MLIELTLAPERPSVYVTPESTVFERFVVSDAESGVGVQIGSDVGAILGVIVGAMLGVAVGRTLGVAVGAMLGVAVGRLLGDIVGAKPGVDVGALGDIRSFTVKFALGDPTS